jgi:MFS family permease
MFGLSMTAAIALGLGRFAYALLVPAMREDLGWSYAELGSLNTANSAGYLLGTLLVPRTVLWLGARRACLTAALTTVLLLLAAGCTNDLHVLAGFRALAGISAAIAFVVGGILAAGDGEREPAHTTLLLGIYFSGGGIGMLLSAVAVPESVQWGGWRAGWMVLALLGLIGSFATAFALATLPNAARPAPRTTSR